MDRILIISAVRNEAQFIERTILSIISQELLPSQWIVVDDGSTDNTKEIVLKYTPKYPWVKLIEKPDRGRRSVGPGVVEAFYYGLARVNLEDFDFICKMDGDVEFCPNYFADLIKKFEQDPKLGAASGKPYIYINNKRIIERTHDEMVAGQINFYRSECFKAIGGFVQEIHWDAIAFHRARMEGWRTRSFPDESLKFNHLRLMGSSYKNVYVGRIRWGKGQFFLGTHPLYLIGIGFYRAVERPYFIGGLLIIIGYLMAKLEGKKKYDFPNFRKSLHAWQLERLGLKSRLENL